MDKFIIYKITNNINGKSYIGQHKTKDIMKDDGYMGSGIILHRAYDKYGIENFTKTIITFGMSQSEINVLEKFYIEKERRENKNGCYNIADGGYTFSELSHSKASREKSTATRIKNGTLKLSEETKKKISEACKGRTPWDKGIKRGPHSEETKKKISEATKGKKLSEETRKKMSESRKGIKRPDLAEYNRTHNHKHIGRKNSEETKKRMSEAAKARWAKKRGEL